MIVHICCSVDSHFFLESLRRDFPDEKLIGFFYDPNIQPYSEYQLRLLDVRRSCKLLDVPLIEGNYNYEEWLKKRVRGFENEPEKGNRCKICFDDRLEKTVDKAVELGEKSFTTSLLVSPKKSRERLLEIGKRLEESRGVEFIFQNYLANGGTQRQSEVVKKNNLYRQDYCGCIFALKDQREQQNREMIETYSPIGNEILPASIEEKIQIYTNMKMNANSSKENILNYRLLSGRVLLQKKAIKSYFLFYSFSERKKISGRVEKIFDQIGYLNREGVKILSLDFVKNILNDETLKLPYLGISVEKQLEIRTHVEKNSYSLSPIIILDEIPDERIEIEFEAKIFSSTVEVWK
jgi:predicted adenine nucleotide alpha hydrolase (AANH) superfamily ATPase